MGPRGVYHPLIHTAKPIPRAGALLARGQTLKNSENPFGKLGINADAVVRHRKELARTRELLVAYDLGNRHAPQTLFPRDGSFTIVNQNCSRSCTILMNWSMSTGLVM